MALDALLGVDLRVTAPQSNQRSSQTHPPKAALPRLGYDSFASQGPAAPTFGVNLKIPTLRRTYSTSAIHDITALAQRHSTPENPVISLGQGTPTDAQPLELRQHQAAMILEDRSRYTLVKGIPALLEAASQHLNREINPVRPYNPEDILVTSGATEAFFVSLQPLVKPGDHVVSADPYYGLYNGSLETALGGQSAMRRNFKTFPLQQVQNPRDGSWSFQFDPKAFESALTDRTKVVILITPHNPTGTRYSKQDLTQIAKIIDRWEAQHPGKTITVISDETYRHITFGDEPHVSAASIPGLQKRLILINTLSKSFNTTGHRVGYLAMPPSSGRQTRLQAAAKAEWMRNMMAVRNVTSMCCSEPDQLMAVKALTETGTEAYYRGLKETYTRRRQVALDLLKNSPFQHHFIPDGGYFIMANVKPVIDHLDPKIKSRYKITDSDSLVRNFLIPELKVAMIPGTGLFKDQRLGRQFVRLSFCQDEGTLRAGFNNLNKLKQYLQPHP